MGGMVNCLTVGMYVHPHIKLLMFLLLLLLSCAVLFHYYCTVFVLHETMHGTCMSPLYGHVQASHSHSIPHMDRPNNRVGGRTRLIVSFQVDRQDDPESKGYVCILELPPVDSQQPGHMACETILSSQPKRGAQQHIIVCTCVCGLRCRQCTSWVHVPARVTVAVPCLCIAWCLEFLVLSSHTPFLAWWFPHIPPRLQHFPVTMNHEYLATLDQHGLLAGCQPDSHVAAVTIGPWPCGINCAVAAPNGRHVAVVGDNYYLWLLSRASHYQQGSAAALPVPLANPTRHQHGTVVEALVCQQFRCCVVVTRCMCCCCCCCLPSEAAIFYPGCQYVAWSHDSRRVAVTADSSGMCVCVFDAVRRVKTHMLDLQRSMMAVAFAPWDADLLVCAQRKEVVHVVKLLPEGQFVHAALHCGLVVCPSQASVGGWGSQCLTRVITGIDLDADSRSLFVAQPVCCCAFLTTLAHYLDTVSSAAVSIPASLVPRDTCSVSATFQGSGAGTAACSQARASGGG